MHRRSIPLLLLAVVLGATACAADETTSPTTPTLPAETSDPASTTEATDPAVDVVDARAYYDDYEESTVEYNVPVRPTPVVVPGAPADAAEAGPGDPDDPEWPGPLEDNVFVDAGDSVWTNTDDDGESTFGLDVDTGSFSVASAFLDEGYLPEPDSIRVEEWVNAVVTEADPPTGGDALGLEVESGPAPHTDDGTQLVRLGVSTVELADEDRPAANLTFVIDTSGSMDIRERLGLVQASLALLVNNLRPDDTIAIVTYGDEARPVLAPTPVAEAETIIAAIDELEPGGSTNMEAGLLFGYEQAREAFRPEALNVVVLASDGVANIGVTDPTVLTEQITQAGEDGISLVTVGYGMGNYNDQLMEQLADQGDGFYSYVDTFEEAERLFVEDLTPTLTVVAGDAKAQVLFDEDVVESYRLIGYENRALDDSEFRDDAVDAGELGAGHHVTALYEVRLDPDAAKEERIPSPDGPALGEVRLRWTDPATGEAVEREVVIPPDFTESSPSFRLAALVANVAELLRGNDVITERGITLDQLAVDADALVAEGEDGAAEIADVVAAAQTANAPVVIDD